MAPTQIQINKRGRETRIYDDPVEWGQALARATSIAVDTETTGLELFCWVRTIQACGEDGMVHILDCRSQDRALRTGVIPEPGPWGPAVAAAFKGKDIIFHNSGFDLSRLTTMFGVEILPPGSAHRLWDTLIAERVLLSGMLTMDHTLGEVVKRRLHIRIPKGLATSFAHHAGPWRPDQIEYMADDVSYLHAIKAAQQLPVNVLKLRRIVEIDMGCLPALSRMEVRGFHLSEELWKICRDSAWHKAQEFGHQAEKLMAPYLAGIQTDMFDLAAPNVVKVLTSHVKLKDMFKAMYGLELANTKKNTFKVIRDDYELADLYIDYSENNKFARDFGDTLVRMTDPFGMLHPTIDPVKKTGRMGMAKPNLQQIPGKEEVRKSFTAPIILRHGYKVPTQYLCIVADYSQMELRVLAVVSGDKTMLRLYREGIDLHTYTASQIFGVAMEVVTKDQRTQAKTMNFAIVYGIRAKNLARQIAARLGREFTKWESQNLIDGFMRLYPEAWAWLSVQHARVWSPGFVRTPLGRIRWFDKPDRKHPDFDMIMGSLEREAANQPIQGANADATKLAIMWLYEWLEPYDAWVALAVHDELISYSPPEYEQEVKDLMQKAMVEAAETFMTGIPVEAKPVSSSAWQK